MSREAFIQGFLKKATESGLANPDELLGNALSLYDGMNKSAAVGLGLDLAAAGVPSAVGAMIGNNYAPISNKELKEELQYHEDPSISKALKYLLVPGYVGYRAAKVNRLNHAYDKYQEQQNQLG